jgi:hypothetical protein
MGNQLSVLAEFELPVVDFVFAGDNAPLAVFDLAGEVASFDFLMGQKGDKGDKGEQGDTGAQGPTGSSYSGVIYHQTLAASSWVIAHNLGTRPSATPFSVGGVEMEGSVTHLSDNVLQIDFNIEIAGYARII